jgi:hypothetical protein
MAHDSADRAASEATRPRAFAPVAHYDARCGRGCVYPRMAAIKIQPTEIQMAMNVPTNRLVSAASPTRRRMLG